jgi:hypothetical protein
MIQIFLISFFLVKKFKTLWEKNLWLWHPKGDNTKQSFAKKEKKLNQKIENEVISLGGFQSPKVREKKSKKIARFL